MNAFMLQHELAIRLACFFGVFGGMVPMGVCRAALSAHHEAHIVLGFALVTV